MRIKKELTSEVLEIIREEVWSDQSLEIMNFIGWKICLEFANYLNFDIQSELQRLQKEAEAYCFNFNISPYNQNVEETKSVSWCLTLAKLKALLCPEDSSVENGDKSIRELQDTLPWLNSYNTDFVANPQEHKDFSHALLHVVKASGKIASIIDCAEHADVLFDSEQRRKELENYIADLVICALRLSNTSVWGKIDLQQAINNRLSQKNK